MNTSQLPPNTPVLVGIGTAMQRNQSIENSVEAVQLMIAAALDAGQDCGAAGLLAKCNSIHVPKGTWSYSDPAQLIANGIGANTATTVLGNIGVLQQSLISNACKAIQAGEQKVALVCGGEAKFRAMQASRQGIEVTETDQGDAEPDQFLTIHDDIISEVEMQRGMAMPVTSYAIMESAMRHAAGESLTQHRRSLGELYAGFSAIAAANPDAWIQQSFTANDIAEASDKNKMLAFPYTKRMNTQWNVDQAAALLFCSVEAARAAGIPEQQWLFPLSATDSEHMTLVSERAALHRCPGAGLAGHRAAELANKRAAEIELLEFYSCFPAAVKAYAHELGTGLDRPLVVTGSMAFAGGPLNNFVLQSTATMARKLRTQPGASGMVSSVSGMLTKQAFAVWSATPGTDGFLFDDVSSATEAATEIRKLVPDYSGKASVAGYTVNRIPGFPESLVAVCDTADGRRAIATSADSALIQAGCEQELCGRNVAIGSDSELTLDP